MIEPKVEVQYLYSPSKNFKTNTNSHIEYSEIHSLNTRAAVKLGYDLKTDSSVIYQSFIEVGVNHGFDGKSDIRYAGGDFKSDVHGTGFDIALGLHTTIKDKIGLFADITYENGSVYEGVSGHLGLRYSFGGK